MTPLRALAIAHIVMGLLFLPASTVFGVGVAPVLVCGPVWFILLALRIWRDGAGSVRTIFITHAASLVFAALLVVWGFAALAAAERSAADGGGLLGGFGVLPLILGVALAVFALISLVVARRERRGVGDVR